MDYNFVNERVATGGMFAGPSDLDKLAADGITHVIDCRAEVDDATIGILSSHPVITYLYLGVQDDGQPKPVDWFAKGIAFAYTALASPNTKLISHCAAGVNRGPSMCYAILRSLGYAPRDAWGAIKAARPQAMMAYAGDADKAILALGY